MSVDAMAGEAAPDGGSITDVVTLEQPLGPHQTDPLLAMGENIFRKLYDDTNEIHHSAQAENPFFIVGRKGAGKTAFLIGAAIADDADVVLIKSEDVYLEVNKLAARYSERNGAIMADTLAYVWEVLLFHAAMLQIARSERLPNSQARQRIWSYVSTFGDPPEIALDGLLAAVSAEMTERLLDAPQRLSFREACWSIGSERGTFADAAEHVRVVLSALGPKALYVVVDNLEELHRKIDDFEEVIAALFRVASRSASGQAKDKLPFRARFAFPAELLPRLRLLAANPEKDFQSKLIIRWSAKELNIIAGNRLRTFLDVRFPKAPAKLGLSEVHDPADADAARQTIKALLPEEVTNGLGHVEDPIAYLMRHTQLLPRHLIFILNEIMSRAAVGLESSDVPRATPEQVLHGVRDAERIIVEGILTTHSYAHPKIAPALEMIKNHIRLALPVSELHRLYNHAGVKRSGLDFDEFLDSCLAVGVLGVAVRQNDSRYIRGYFSYTFANEVRPVEDRDEVCVHPLFVWRLFDAHAIRAMQGHLAVYPYGSDQDDILHEV